MFHAVSTSPIRSFWLSFSPFFCLLVPGRIIAPFPFPIDFSRAPFAGCYIIPSRLRFECRFWVTLFPLCCFRCCSSLIFCLSSRHGPVILWIEFFALSPHSSLSRSSLSGKVPHSSLIVSPLLIESSTTELLRIPCAPFSLLLGVGLFLSLSSSAVLYPLCRSVSPPPLLSFSPLLLLLSSSLLLSFVLCLLCLVSSISPILLFLRLLPADVLFSFCPVPPSFSFLHRLLLSITSVCTRFSVSSLLRLLLVLHPF